MIDWCVYQKILEERFLIEDYQKNNNCVILFAEHLEHSIIGMEE